MNDLEIYSQAYPCLTPMGKEIFCLNENAWEKRNSGFQTKELIEEHDESAHYCCAMDPDGKKFDLSRIKKCSHKRKQKLVFHGEKIEGNKISEEELERIESERQRFYEIFNQIKKSFCPSIKPIHPFLYCLNDKAEDKENGAIKKLEKVYFCCAMDPDGKNYDLGKILNCPYKNKSE